jgi:protein-tyrosine-phosphatase
MLKKRILILCTGNSARSQMAEALLRHDAGERFEVESAGTRPKHVDEFGKAAPSFLPPL